MPDEKIDIKSLEPEQIRGFLSGLGQPGFRAAQIFRWMHTGARSFSEMTDLPSALREALEERCRLFRPGIESKMVSPADGTVKYLWRLHDGNCVESVLMSYRHGNTVCISTQAGCKMGCAFCASSKLGFSRSLEPSEMLDEVLSSQEDSGHRISNVVLMGIGEPLDNFDNVAAFLRLINSRHGLNIGMRHVSLSTCGIGGMIRKLAMLRMQLTLSVSLHAPDDATRSELMPSNRAMDIRALLSECDEYFSITGRRVSYEYALMRGVNDSVRQAELLAGLLRGKGGHVNLIQLNAVEGSPLQPSRRKDVERFMNTLEGSGINVTLRRRLGGDINASCGQLRRKRMETS